jgi:DHA1 family multidrug resistance protein-like MFS transporter
MLFVFRMVQGAISGFIASALALVSANTPRERSGYAIGLLQTASSSGVVVGPLIGGTLADLVGFRPLFFIVAALCAVAGVVVIRRVTETEHRQATSASVAVMIDNYRFTLRSTPIRVALAIILLAQSAVLMIQPVFSLFVESIAGGSAYLATIAGAIFSTAGLFTVIGAPFWGRRNDAKSYRKNLTIALIGAGVSYVAQGLATTAIELILLRALQGFCLGGILPALYSYVSKHAPIERRGGIMGIASSTNVLASMIGPTLGGAIAAQMGLRMNFFVTGMLMIPAVLIVRMLFIDLRSPGNLPAETHPEVGERILEEAGYPS